ncbi:MAG: hypothetical protein QM784_04410 [Polyangiaceae bacterium]
MTRVPKRPFGRSGVEVAKLCLGGSSVVGTDSQALLDGALGCGIDCWEFNPFCGRVFGDYFRANPGVRERVFLTAKARSFSPTILQEDLDSALADNEASKIRFLRHSRRRRSLGVDEGRTCLGRKSERRWEDRSLWVLHAQEDGELPFVRCNARLDRRDPNLLQLSSAGARGSSDGTASMSRKGDRDIRRRNRWGYASRTKTHSTGYPFRSPN